MNSRNVNNLKARILEFWRRKPVKIGIGVAIILVIVGSVGALNGWFGGGGRIPEDTFTRGLVGSWNFDEGTGHTIYDSSGQGHHGIIPLTQGEACSTSSECFSGFCVDGYCCNTACSETCYGCDVSGSNGTCTAAITNWESGDYGCGSEGGDQRCYSGTCYDCSDTGGYLYDDGCDDCAGQGGKACWRNAAKGSTCTSACGAYGGCISDVSVNDSSNCTVCKHFHYGADCSDFDNVMYPGYYEAADVCRRRWPSGPMNCGVSNPGVWKLCVCNY